MRIFDLIRLAFEALRSHKLRTFLTMFGIIIGVTSVIAIISIVDGMNWKIKNMINQMGSSTFIISKYGIEEETSYEAYLKARKRKDLKIRDMSAIARGCEYCDEVGARLYTFRRIKHESQKTKNVVIAGTTHNILDITDMNIEEGRIFNQFEQERYHQVAVIGPRIAEDLFSNEDPIGKTITIGTHKYKIIGITEARGSMLGQDLDNYALVPVTAFQKNFGSQRTTDILVKAKSEELLPEAIDQARVIMRARRKVSFSEPDDFAITTTQDWLEFYDKTTGILQTVAIGIPMIAMVVAGIVVMNIMMVSVTERTREIGIRKSVGAQKKHVLLQFLAEALMMSLIGGAIGIGLGISLAKVLTDAGDMPFIISRFAILGGLFISMGIGVIFGLYPAFKGARLNPIEAMRFET
jgi:putative ABC transport system permease protein